MAMNYNNLTPPYDYEKQRAFMQAMGQIADGNMLPTQRSLPQRLMQPNPNITRDTLNTLIPRGMQGLGRLGGMVRNALPDNMQRMPIKRQGGVMRNTPQPNYRMFQR